MNNDNTMIMADFDQTLSKYTYPASLQSLRYERTGLESSNLGDATMKVMLECDKFSTEQKKEVRDLFVKYRPIEIDRTIPHHIRC